MLKKLCAIASFIAIIAPLSALAYTQQDADACTPDAMRLCQNAIPDVGQVARCLAGLPACLARRKPLPWKSYRGWMELLRSPVTSEQEWKERFGALR